jgi:hypothetical protein
MNKKRKILTVVAMVAFGAVVALHYVGFDPYPHIRPPSYKIERPIRGRSHYETTTVMNDNVINDVRMPLFALAVFYAGLFALLGDDKRKEQ